MVKTLLVTSRVTLVPRNYDALIIPLADCSCIGGLLELENRSGRLLLTMLGFGAIGARRVCATFLRNWFGATERRRRAAFASAGKPVFRELTVNTPAVVTGLRKDGYDLMLNARTRCRYGPSVLSAPRLGCLNIHHGLLPEQRGTMCDLWALFEGRPAGFSIHVMTAAIDAGPIVNRTVVSDGSEIDYPGYLLNACTHECAAVEAVLEQIAATQGVNGKPNIAVPGARLYRNPTREQVRSMRRKGLLL